jgi:hypothetical protein
MYILVSIKFLVCKKKCFPKELFKEMNLLGKVQAQMNFSFLLHLNENRLVFAISLS